MAKTAQKIQQLLRSTHLLTLADKVRCQITLMRNRVGNKAFVAANPGFKLPPVALAYDAYSAPEWEFYKRSGMETAAFLAGVLRKHLPGQTGLRVLEWGCGPARVIRHLPEAIGNDAQVYGTDYNTATITWCRESIPGVHFDNNQLEPPLPFEENFFDFIYSISVFTHLSETVSRQWAAELLRVSKPGDVLSLTVNGDSFTNKMLPQELKSYQETGVLMRAQFEEGKRCFIAVHSPNYVRDVLFKDFKILEHLPAGFPFTGQDIWILQKPE